MSRRISGYHIVHLEMSGPFALNAVAQPAIELAPQQLRVRSCLLHRVGEGIRREEVDRNDFPGKRTVPEPDQVLHAMDPHALALIVQ